MDIIRYKREHENDVLSAIEKDPNWHIFTNEETSGNYRKRLSESITYVCYNEKAFSGYLRAILDDGISVYISELFVVPEMRNNKIGRALITKLKTDYSNLSVYALSDEDLYYEKLGYRKVGSVYEINH